MPALHPTSPYSYAVADEFLRGVSRETDVTTVFFETFRIMFYGTIPTRRRIGTLSYGGFLADGIPTAPQRGL